MIFLKIMRAFDYPTMIPTNCCSTNKHKSELCHDSTFMCKSTMYAYHC